MAHRSEFLAGRDQIVAFRRRKWTCELDYRLVKELWAFHENRIAVRFAYEWHDDSDNWFRSYGNENWEFNENGLMTMRYASINDLPLREQDRKYHWPLGHRPTDHLGLSDFGALVAFLAGASHKTIKENNMLAGIKALTFDTGGTILDWHTGLCQAFAQAGAQHGLSANWPEITNEYRRRALKLMVSAVDPSFNIEDVHRRMLDEVIDEFKLTALTPEDRVSIWRKWHVLGAWPDVPPALARLKTKYVVVSFTILSTSLVIDVSRHDALTWDCIVSCEMIGTYKTQPQAYRTCAQWLGYRPDELLMVACHNFDLMAAREEGYLSAFVHRPAEWGPAGPPDPIPNPAHDIIAQDFADLTTQLGA